MRVEVIYALRARQRVRRLELPKGATVRDALRAARLPVGRAAGIFGRVAEPGARLRDGDRVEIYRALRADPKEARRRRAALRR